MKAGIGVTVALVITLMSSGAYANSGADLLDQCQSAVKPPATMNALDTYKSGFCQGTITSVIALSAVINDGLPANSRVCVHQYGVTNIDIVHAVVSFLRTNPADKAQDASTATFLAMQHNYPCK